MVRICSGDKNRTDVPTITMQFLTYNFHFQLLHRAVVCESEQHVVCVTLSVNTFSGLAAVQLPHLYECWRD